MFDRVINDESPELPSRTAEPFDTHDLSPEPPKLKQVFKVAIEIILTARGTSEELEQVRQLLRGEKTIEDEDNFLPWVGEDTGDLLWQSVITENHDFTVGGETSELRLTSVSDPKPI